MKGVILTVDPSATIVDITHHIDPQDILSAAYMLRASYRFFPKKTVHVSVVDPGVGSKRDIVALKKSGHIFVAPDNGILTPILEEGQIDSVVTVENPDFFLDILSQTFHGRDIFAPVAGHLSRGVALGELGSRKDPQRLKRLTTATPYLSSRGELVGMIISIDRFGNLITNIGAADLERMNRRQLETLPTIRIAEYTIRGISSSYQHVPHQTPLAIVGSRGYLEIAVNCGSAKDYFKAQKGEVIRLSC
jgi:S-adenosylmethionine hydrolase